MRFYARGEYAESVHGPVVAVEIVLYHFHGLELLEPRLLRHLVLSVVGIVLEVSHIGDVADIAHSVAQMAEVAEKDVEGNGRARMSQMGVAVDCGAADIHAHHRLMEGLEHLLLAAHGIVNGEHGGGIRLRRGWECHRGWDCP